MNIENTLKENAMNFINHTNKKLIRMIVKFEGEMLIGKLRQLNNEVLGFSSALDFISTLSDERKELVKLNHNILELIDREITKQ